MLLFMLIWELFPKPFLKPNCSDIPVVLLLMLKRRGPEDLKLHQAGHYSLMR